MQALLGAELSRQVTRTYAMLMTACFYLLTNGIRGKRRRSGSVYIDREIVLDTFMFKKYDPKFFNSNSIRTWKAVELESMSCCYKG